MRKLIASTFTSLDGVMGTKKRGQSTNLDKPALVRGAMVPASLALFEWISANGGNQLSVLSSQFSVGA